MKKNKLTLDKFVIARLNDSRKIRGGSDNDGTDTRTNNPKCIQTSKIIIQE